MSAVNILHLRDKFKGRRCFIVGTGPSLNDLDLSKLKGEVVFASNAIFRRDDVVPDVYCVEDRKLARDLKDEINAYDVPGLKLFPYDLRGVLTGDAYFSFRRHWEYAFKTHVLEGIQWGATVTYALLQLAHFMGCGPAIMIGMDCTQEHFVPNADYYGKHAPNKPHWEHVFRCYQMADWAFRDAGTALLNATPGGRLDVLERVKFADLF